MTNPPGVTPMRATMLMDAPEGAVRRALARTDIWTRTARAAGARADVATSASLPPGRGLRSPLRSGDLIRVRADDLARREISRGISPATWRTIAGRGSVWPARSLIFRVALEPAPPELPALPVLELLAGPLKSCRISIFTTSTPAGTMVTVDCRAVASPAALTPLLRRRILGAAQLLLGIAMLTAREIQVVVAGAVLAAPRTADPVVLAARRTGPPELAGRWELPGGKVDPGESDQEALARELAEELGVAVAVGEQIGDSVDLGDNRTLRCYLAEIVAGEPIPTEHDALRWVGAADLDTVDWLDADRALLPDLRRRLEHDRRHR